MSQQFIEGFRPSAEQLQEATLKWASDRGIIQNGKPITQMQKLASEVGELMDNIAKNRDIKDDIGDCIVVLVNIAGIMKLDISDSIRHIHMYEASSYVDLDRGEESLTILLNIGMLAQDIKNKDCSADMSSGIIDVVRALGWLVSTYKGFDLIDCWLHAYNDIKGRKGYLNENGNFIKEGDVE